MPQPAGIKLEHRGLRDPRIGQQPEARLRGIEKQQRGAAGHSGKAQDVLAADFMLAGERDLGNAEAGAVGSSIADVLHLRGDRRRMAAFDHAVIGAGEQQHGGGAGAGAARHFQGEQRAAPAAREAQNARVRRRPGMHAQPPGGRCTSFQFQLQRLSEASSIIHRDRLFKTLAPHGQQALARARFRSCPDWYPGVVVATQSHARIHGERAKRRHCLVFGPFGKRLVKVYGLCAGRFNLGRALQIQRDFGWRLPIQRGVLDHPAHQLFEADAGVLRELGHQRHFGHAGLGIHLQAGETLGAAETVVVAEVGAADAAAAERAVRGQRQAPAFLVNFL